jgi:hypothetical protein
MSTRNYISMSDKRYDTIADGIYKSYPHACIVWIEEVSNPKLEELYQKKKKEIETIRGKPCSEPLLYHGTQEKFLNSISAKGFNPTINKRSMYGKGSYFARDASYSREYAAPASDNISFLVLCNILFCEATVYPRDAVIDTTKYDNSVDNLKNPSIYVTPYAEGAIPRYIVAFHKDAK